MPTSTTPSLSKTELLAHAVVRHLENLPPDVVAVSSRSLRAMFGDEVAKSVWQTARDRALSQVSGWRLADHSLVRSFDDPEGDRGRSRCRLERAQALKRSRAIRSYKKNRGARLVNAARVRARKAGIPFDLDPADIQARIDAGRCEATGIPFVYTTGVSRPPFSPSLDRISSAGGYTKANVRVVVWAFNLACGTWGDAPTEKVARGRLTMLAAQRMSPEGKRFISNVFAALGWKPRPLGRPTVPLTIPSNIT